MWIAACDDDMDYGNWIIQTLVKIVSDDDQITFFNNGIELLETVNKAKRPIDMILLDIEMPGLSGIESAREIRQICPSAVIVIVTNYNKYALQCYEVKAFEYLLKPLNIERLKQTIEDARNISESLKGRIIHIETREYDVFIPLCDLLYIESYCRSLYAHTRGKSYKFNRQISQIDKELVLNGFYRIHKSYIVNLSHIKRIDKSAKMVILSSGEEMPVSSRKIKDLISALIEIRGASHERF